MTFFDPFEFGIPVSGELTQACKTIQAVWQKDEFENFKTTQMIQNAQNVLSTSKLPDEAYLGAIAVLMLNDEI